ncbi:hypothetical protein CF328_g9645, partial [Tilletia controversa]
MAGLQSAPSASISSNNSDTATAVPAVGESASALRPPPLAVLSFTPDGTERIFRFEFPERPNALQKFLVTLHETNTKYPRNITLFHYRNYGSDVGKVLAGIAV